MAKKENHMGFMSKLLSFGSDKDLKRYYKIVDQINGLEPQFEKMTEEELRAQTDKFRERYANGESLDDMLPEAFATVREASKRITGMRHFDVQLIGAMALGFVQIVTGMAISFVEKLKKGEIMDAIWEELTWWVVFAGIACMALGVTNIVLYVGIGMVVVGSGWSAKGFGKVTAIFGSVYNHVTGYFGDILSYSRLMTLMLAGSVIASVFNTLGAIPGNVVIFLIVSMLGNGLNFALNLLSCYVHDLRLQCLEYFGKFYKDGGRPFKPLAINTKYVDIQS